MANTKRFLLIDCYDSFTRNLEHELAKACIVVDGVAPEIIVIRPEEVGKAEDITSYTALILSPGPGKPSDYPAVEATIRQFADTLPILGICLGHQMITEVAGGKVALAKRIVHGKSSTMMVSDHSPALRLFDGVQDLRVARYHSLVAEEESLPEDVEVLAKLDPSTGEDELMAIKWKGCTGLQFHPESILTPEGGKIFENWLRSIC